MREGKTKCVSDRTTSEAPAAGQGLQETETGALTFRLMIVLRYMIAAAGARACVMHRGEHCIRASASARTREACQEKKPDEFVHMHYDDDDGKHEISKSRDKELQRRR